MDQKIYIKPYETTRTEPDGECVAYYHEDVVAAKEARIAELERRRDELQENNTKLMLENRAHLSDLDKAVRENEKYLERHKAWENMVYLFNPVPDLIAVRDTEFGDAVLPVPRVKSVTKLLDHIADLEAQLAEARESAVG